MAEQTPYTLTEGQTVGAGRFMLVRLLGEGGMGVVWLARDSRFHDEEVALRFLPPEVASDPAAVAELQRDTRKSRSLAHPHIMRIHDLHEAPGEPAFLAVEYVDGSNLADLRLHQPQGCLAWDFLRPLVVQLCQALEYAHGEGVVHRDLKPSNLMLDSRGRLKVADFGIAASISDSVSRAAQGEARSGTAPYMSPQQIAGEPPQPTDDIHALGATLYELLAGKPPYCDGDTVAIMRQVVEEAAPPLAQRLVEAGAPNPVPESVSATIMACLAKDAAQRPQSAQAALEQMLDLASVAPEPIAETEVEPAPSHPPSFRKLKLAWICLVVLAFIGIAGYGIKKLVKFQPVSMASTNRRTNSLGQIFVSVPGIRAKFSVWDTRLKDYEAFVAATDRNVSVSIASVKNDKWTEQGDTLRHPGFEQVPNSPVCGVNWADAQAFCKWLTKQERRQGLLTEHESYRLPTDAEWNAAVGEDLYPWGDQWPPPEGAGNYAGMEVDDGSWPARWTKIEGYRDGYPRTSPVGTFKPNRYGLYDMGGNVSQWCDDWYRKELNNEAMRQSMPFMERDNGGKHSKVLRGGSWRLSEPGLLMSGCRYFNVPNYRSTDVGFRCVLSDEPAPEK